MEVPSTASASKPTSVTPNKKRTFTETQDTIDLQLLFDVCPIPQHLSSPEVESFAFPNQLNPPPQQGYSAGKWLDITLDEDGTDEDFWESGVGSQSYMDSIFRRNDRKIYKKFETIPDLENVKWCLRTIDNVPKIGPVLQSTEKSNHIYVILPSSFKHATKTGVLSIPDCSGTLHNKAEYMCIDNWFEDCGDGGLYLLRFDDEILIYYIDGPGDMIYSYWKISVAKWEQLWMDGFGSLYVEHPHLLPKRERVATAIVQSGINDTIAQLIASFVDVSFKCNGYCD